MRKYKRQELLETLPLARWTGGRCARKSKYKGKKKYTIEGLEGFYCLYGDGEIVAINTVNTTIRKFTRIEECEL